MKTHLGAVEGRAAGPLEHGFVDVAVIAAEDRVEHLVVVVEGVHQQHGVGPHLGQQLLKAPGDRQHLGPAQHAGLPGVQRAQ